MKTQLNILLGGLGLFALQGCKAPQAEQSVQPNVIYVFPDQYRNQAMEFWGQEGFRPGGGGIDICHEQLPVEQSPPWFSVDGNVS